MNKWMATGAWGLALAVGIGAFGAHGLRGRLDAYSMDIYERAVFYHFIHALGIVIVATATGANLVPRSSGVWVCRLLTAGVVLFSGSLYTLALTGNRMLGAITPFGGLAFIAAWVVLAISFWPSRVQAVTRDLK
jgi:uncharacterized membrane protein YgdD (TMEM256/DUF423 family)